MTILNTTQQTCKFSMRAAFFSLAFLFFVTISNTQPVLELSPVISTGLSSPIQLVHAGDGTNRIFIAQKGGTIRAYDDDYNFLSVFLTISSLNTDGEQGLLSMAFHPDYENNGLFYIYFTNSSGDLELARYQVSSGDPNVADTTSKVIVITIPHPDFDSHNGGELHFGSDGYLYLSTGDGGGFGDPSDNAQNSSSLLGKILRFDVNTSSTPPYYSIPAGNPFGNEVFNLGLRNPFRWSFDRLTNDMWIGDVGQNAWEEINFREADSTSGVNWGWRCYEGNSGFNLTGCDPSSNYVFPAHVYAVQHPAAVTGGVVYRGSVYPSLQGYYISADFYSGVFYMVSPDGSGGWDVHTQTISPNGIVDFGETEGGELFVVSLIDNSVHQVTIPVALPVSLISFTGNAVRQGAQLYWETAMEQNLSHFEIEFSINGTAFTHFASHPARNAANGASYNALHTINHSGKIYYRLKTIDIDDSHKYSEIIEIRLNGFDRKFIYPNIITSDLIHALLPQDSKYNHVEIIGIDGALLLRKSIRGQSGAIRISYGNISAGIYIVRFTGESETVIQKILISRDQQ